MSARIDQDSVPMLLLSYQQEAIELSHAHPLLVIEKSRRTGITYAFAADAVLTAAADKAGGGMNAFYIAYNLDMTREFIAYCASFAKAFDRVAAPTEFLFDDGSEEGIKAFRIDFPSGFSIVALSSKPRSLRGKQGLVIIDEAAFHDNFDELLKAALALLMWGGRVVVVSTHDGADNPFNVLIEDIRSGKRHGEVMRLDIDQALAQGLYERICLVGGTQWSPEGEAAWLAGLKRSYGDGADEELYCIPARGSGIYLPRATIAAAMVPEHVVLRLRLPDGFELRPQLARTDFVAEWFEVEVKPILATFDPRRRTAMGGDCGRVGDLSAFAFGQEDELLVLQVRLIIELRNCPFREQEWLLRAILSRVPLFSAAKMDARGLGWNLAENIQTDFGFDRVEAVQSSQRTYIDGFPKLKSRIEDRRAALPLDEGVRDDLGCVKLVRGVPMVVDRRNTKLDGAKGQRHGDTAIALMFLATAIDEDVVPIELHTLGIARPSAEALTITSTGFGTVRRADYGGF